MTTIRMENGGTITASGRPTGEIASVDSSREKVRAEWKRRQALQPSHGTLLAPTLPERIARLSPSERHDLSRLIKSMKLRKIIRRTLAEAFWNRETDEIAASGTMQRLRAAVRSHESMTSYDSASTSFEPVITQSQQPTLIEVPR